MSRKYKTGIYKPWVMIRMPVDLNRKIILHDLATAGRAGAS
jgi:hypothetical protein